MENYIQVDGLHIQYDDGEQAVAAISFYVKKGESVGFMGESGSGKSSIALALMGLLPKRAYVDGHVTFQENRFPLHDRKQWQSLRWKEIAIVFQNSADILNPVLTIGNQLVETMKQHRCNHDLQQVLKYIQMVGLDDTVIHSYPHQLSGGMRQKVLIALALCCEPQCIIVDEPTMALDAVAKREIVELLLRLQQQQGVTFIVISHEFSVLAALTSRLYVLYAGKLIESGQTEKLLHAPKHPYTFGLVNASPALHPFRDLWGIAGEMKRTTSQCAFYERCFQKQPACLTTNPSLLGDEGHAVACVTGGIRPLLQATSISKNFYTQTTTTAACINNHLTVYTGEIVALIGQSGSGKSTLAKIVAGIQSADSGDVYFLERKVQLYEQTAKKYGIQYIFQDPFSAINEQLSVLQIVSEPLEVIERLKRTERIQRVQNALQQVGLPTDKSFLIRKGFQCSGGMRQRLAIARALIVEPKLVIADEITAMLDASTAANILRLLKGLQVTSGFSMLFITHDLALAQKIADRIIVMKDGTLIETGSTTKVLTAPSESYTKTLVKHIHVPHLQHTRHE